MRHNVWKAGYALKVTAKALSLLKQKNRAQYKKLMVENGFEELEEPEFVLR